MNRRLFLGAGVAVLGLSACATVPRSSPPQVETPAGWRTDLGGAGAIDPKWWQGFGDPVLTALVETALAHNIDLAIAAGRVAEARALEAASRAALLPTLDLGLPGQRARALNAFGNPTETTTFQPQLQAAYEIDLWGKLASQDAAARASVLASETARDAAALSIAATVAGGYITLRAIDARLVVARQTLTSREKALRFAKSRADAGYTSQLELNQAQAEYRATTQLIPQLELARAKQEDALRVLLGQAPGDVQRGLELYALTSPPIPGGLPSDLLRRRPDIAQAEHQVAAADASLASARAQLLPSIRLTAATGFIDVSSLPDPISIWSIGGSVLAPLFNGGRLRAGVDVASARRDQAVEGYRKVVLTAFSEVEDSLASVRRLAEQETELVAQRTAVAEALRHATNRYQAGYSPYLEELDAQRSLLSVELSLVQLRADILNARVSLYRAMGGGWSGG